MEILVLCLAAFFASMLNAGAGGGSFITFPALVHSGYSLTSANAISTVALFPGALSSAWGFRNSLNEKILSLAIFSLLSIVGSIAGTYLFLWTDEAQLKKLIPILILFATVLIFFKDRVKSLKIKENPYVVYPMQFLVGVYGGYFGGGMGIMMIAVFSLYGMKNFLQINALKSILGFSINLVAATIFILQVEMPWPTVLAMIGASLLGGYAGARVMYRLSEKTVKTFVVIVGIVSAVLTGLDW